MTSPCETLLLAVTHRLGRRGSFDGEAAPPPVGGADDAGLRGAPLGLQAGHPQVALGGHRGRREAGDVADAADRGSGRVEAGRGGQLDGAAAQPRHPQGFQLRRQHRIHHRQTGGQFGLKLAMKPPNKFPFELQPFHLCKFKLSCYVA